MTDVAALNSSWSLYNFSKHGLQQLSRPSLQKERNFKSFGSTLLLMFSTLRCLIPVPQREILQRESLFLADYREYPLTM